MPRLTYAPDSRMNVLYNTFLAGPVRTVSLMTANQEFSKLIKEVERGEGFLITRRGQPIAKLVPHAGARIADPEFRAAYEHMMALMDKGAKLGGLTVDRDTLYDR
jgi:prevent-host-death family protein